MNSDKKILIIEDDELMVKILKFILNKEGYQLSVIKDGLSAVEQIHSINPDMVITDLLLPYKSGLEVIRFVKENFEKIPIIVLSALGEEEHSVSEVFKLGADDFIAKPFNPNELVLRVKRLLNH
ncbi:response regulator transcription factor [Flavobacterium sinopsychrotolerans]|jgi:two-component system response regulator VicR|uniref:Response regulator receiver domain-containing protein n=2 Tax=Flavobacterium TaxID=237 RepID=A0A495S898_9FLAO|nr:MULTISPECIES: response regulator transcription factor [Flavobacterium]RKS95731.1 response regulator receiver domain-containing protein [Flavobacterium limicola]SEO39017.1 Response regulator receiver domain-containing protein [Flavobacterium sinopsychrotolerans]